MTEKTVAYIHGLNSTELSFRYIYESLPEHRIVSVNYNSHQPLIVSLEEVVKQLPRDVNFSLVGHSLGGIIAAILASSFGPRIENLITISSPLGGSKAANFVRWLPGHPLVIGDIVPSSDFISSIQNSPVAARTTSIISVGGHLASGGEPNDSVVSIASQKALPYGKKVEVKANHFEVLMANKTITTIRKQIFGE